MRYRSARIVPGVKPPAGIESDEMRRAEGVAGAKGLRTAAVAICEGEPIARPHARQNRLVAGTSSAHDEHRMVTSVTDSGGSRSNRGETRR